MSLQILHRKDHTQLLLDRPHRANAYDRATLERLSAALSDRKQPVLVVGSMGDGAFCAGADLKEVGHAAPEDALDLFSQKVFAQLAAFPGVTIAAVGGPAVAGGCELALACDLRIAGPKARFQLPETALGLIPAAGGCSRLPTLIGVGRAKEMVLLGRSIDGPTALAWGLVNQLADDPLAAAEDMASQLAQRDPLALRLAKEILSPELAGSLARERVSEALLYGRRNGGESA